jgi:uncharacterized protein YdhG (YjbR/CyaY superfamily)
MSTDQSAPTTIDAYLAAFPPEVQALLQQIRQVIHEAVPNLGETISCNTASVCSSICKPARSCLPARTLVQ